MLHSALCRKEAQRRRHHEQGKLQQVLRVCEVRKRELHPGQGKPLSHRGRGAERRGDGGGPLQLADLAASILLRDRLAQEGGQVQGVEELHRVPADSQCKCFTVSAGH